MINPWFHYLTRNTKYYYYLFVALNKQKECAEILQKAGADPNCVADNHREEECGKLLERAGVDPLLISNFGDSACTYNRDVDNILNCKVRVTSFM